ncbi:MAG: hypothetical protein ACE5GG_00395 [Candidatus Omnitrophota bacterium]
MPVQRNYKISLNIERFILAQKQESPGLSCRAISVLVRRRFNLSVSKSRINDIIRRDKGLDFPASNPALPPASAPLASAPSRPAHFPSVENLPRVCYIHFGLFDGTVFYVDAKFQAIGKNHRHISQDLCSPADKVINHIKSRIIKPGGQPIVIRGNKMNERQAWINFVLCCEGVEDKALSRIALYDKNRQEIKRFSYIPRTERRYFIIGMRDSKFVWSGKIVFSWKGNKFSFRIIRPKNKNTPALISNISFSENYPPRIIEMFNAAAI